MTNQSRITLFGITFRAFFSTFISLSLAPTTYTLSFLFDVIFAQLVAFHVKYCSSILMPKKICTLFIVQRRRFAHGTTLYNEEDLHIVQYCTTKKICTLYNIVQQVAAKRSMYSRAWAAEPPKPKVLRQ